MNIDPDTEISGTVYKMNAERDPLGSVVVAHTRADDGTTSRAWLRLDHAATDYLTTHLASSAPVDTASRISGYGGSPSVEFFPAENRAGIVLRTAIREQVTDRRREIELMLDSPATYHLLARMTRLMPDPPTGPWTVVDELVGWLDLNNGHGEQETAARLLKLSEEVGEVAAAYIGATGQNPRTGTTHTAEDVADELCDVIVTAMVALHRFTANPEQHFAAKVAHVQRRMREDTGQTRCTCDDWRDDPCPAHPDPDDPYDHAPAEVEP